MWRGFWSALLVVALVLAGFPANRAVAGTLQHVFVAAEASCECKTDDAQCGQAKTECAVEQCLAFCGGPNPFVPSGRVAVFRAEPVARADAVAFALSVQLRNEHPPFRPPRS